MNLLIGADHGGRGPALALAAHLRGAGHDVGTRIPPEGSSSDYPDEAHEVAGGVARGQADRGILICRTGIGMSMVANRHAGVRAALIHDEVTAKQSRRHNDANVACFGADVVETARILALTDLWLEEPFDGGRHAPRVAKIEIRVSPSG